jgi:hypothetical protein
MKALVQLLGLSVPFTAGVAIYTLFKFLDRKASVAANRAIVAWMQRENYKQLDLATAVISAFDHLYGTPLLRLKTFMRSASLSMCAVFVYNSFIMFVVIHEALHDNKISILVGGEEVVFNLKDWVYKTVVGFVASAILIIPSDYLSLFFVRMCLKMARGKVILSIISAFVCAISAITALSLVFITLSTMGLSAEHLPIQEFWVRVEIGVMVTAPGWLVHLWLPLFLVGAAINSGLNAFFRTVRFAQWFIQRGNAHPFEAIGITASVVTFVGAVLLQGIFYLL